MDKFIFILAFTTYLWTIQAYSCNCEIPGLSGYTNIKKSILANVRLLKSSAPADGRIPLVYIPICGPCSATAAYNQIAVPANCPNGQQVPINQQLSRSNVDLHPQAGIPQLLVQQETGPQQLGLGINLSQHPSVEQVDNYQKIDNNQPRTYVQQGHQQYLNSNGIVKQVDEFQQTDNNNNQQRTDLLQGHQQYVIAHRSGSGDYHQQSSESYQRIRNLLQQQLQQYAQSSGSKSYQRIAVADQVGNSQTTLHGSQAARSELDETLSSNRQQQYDTNYETSLGSGTYQSVHITNQPSSENDESVSKNSAEHVHHDHEKEKNVHYKFEYAVNDKKTGDIKRHSEERQGDVVRGEYSLVEEDGNVRTVRYYADWKSGFHAQVHNSKQKPAG